jgi:hypothetical protein
MNIVIDKKLEHGFYIVRKVQKDGTTPERSLARILLNNEGEVINFIEFFSSKFEYKCLNIYEKELKTNKTLVKNFSETLEGLTVTQLQNMLPSYYQDEIKAKIEELNAVAKVNRSRKGTVKTGNRKRNISKKSV